MKGYSQHEGIDYHEIFSSVAILKSIHTLLAIATFHNYEIADGYENYLPK